MLLKNWNKKHALDLDDKLYFCDSDPVFSEASPFFYAIMRSQLTLMTFSL